MDKAEIRRKLLVLNWPKEDYWVVAGGAMVLYGLRAETRDLDLGCTAAWADALEASGVPFRNMDDGSGRWFTLDTDVEVFENWLIDRTEIVEDIPVISLKGLIEMKRALGREKDIRDIALIKKAMEADPSLK